MSIRDLFKKINSNIALISAMIILLGFASFGLGRLSAENSNKESLKVYPNSFIATQEVEFVNKPSPTPRIEETAEEGSPEPSSDPSQDKTLYVGSKNSNKVHYPWCSGAQRIKEDNKVWFESLEEAKLAGYEPAGNCPGL